MTDVPADELTVPTAPVRRSLLALIVRNPLALTGLTILVLMTLVAIFAGVLAPDDPMQTALRLRNAEPGTPGHLLGADGAGRDILSRLIFGARLTLLGAALATVMALLVGVPAGLVAGYYGGVFDAVTSWVADVLLSIPGKVVLLAVISAFGPSVLITMTAFGVLLSPTCSGWSGRRRAACATTSTSMPRSSPACPTCASSAGTSSTSSGHR